MVIGTETKARIYGDNVYTNFRSLNVPVDSAECEFFTIISIKLFTCLRAQILPTSIF